MAKKSFGEKVNSTVEEMFFGDKPEAPSFVGQVATDADGIPTQKPQIGYKYMLVEEKRTRRVQFMLAPSVFKAVNAVARKQKISLSEYFNRLVKQDLAANNA